MVLKLGVQLGSKKHIVFFYEKIITPMLFANMANAGVNHIDANLYLSTVQAFEIKSPYQGASGDKFYSYIKKSA